MGEVYEAIVDGAKSIWSDLIDSWWARQKIQKLRKLQSTPKEVIIKKTRFERWLLLKSNARLFWRTGEEQEEQKQHNLILIYSTQQAKNFRFHVVVGHIKVLLRTNQHNPFPVLSSVHPTHTFQWKTQHQHPQILSLLPFATQSKHWGVALMSHLISAFYTAKGHLAPDSSTLMRNMPPILFFLVL